MKTIKILALFLVFGLAFASCSDDDDENASSVAGNKYELTYVKMEMSGSMVITIELKTKEELVENEMYFVVEFKSDGKVYVDNELDGTWTQNGSTITIVSSDAETMTANVDGNQFTVKMTENDGDDTTKIEMRFSKI